ncbi:hypothetical protein BV509_01000 [Rhodovulum sulfidophilum]|uniref:Transcription-repair coupling factor n=1 Tax=Rhodovulum visakhapatnamense TaxID=364297 RepID=A0ABS1RFG8_9RHOB|nr:hypothetical protein [Rhodovulum visakhapatnamense]MBL3569913.1 hypothetical protein [Rhodovulum visakhapatnamense]MBL3578394.1 hypothetical protein [Rhodovulum visakhapatnamense]OLS43066.1 hypothetical protein BV509_01000 [Rhodovulum sulfidophilum]
MKWLDEKISEMLAGNHVVVVTSGPIRARQLMAEVARRVEGTVKVSEHFRRVDRLEFDGSIHFATIDEGGHESLLLADSVSLDPDFPSSHRRQDGDDAA